MTKIAHIINPVKVQQTSDLFYAQPITFESMSAAKELTEVEVELLSTQYEEDTEIIPDYFKILPNLKRSIMDVVPEAGKRKLPLIGDIVGNMYQHSDAEYLIYTNVDIGVMPQFYNLVNYYIAKGYDAIVINRRRVPAHLNKMEDLPLIYSEIGKSHPGFDCFVFHRSIFEKMVFGDICVGIPFIGVALAHNLFCMAKKPLYLPDVHATFHIGEDVAHSNRTDLYKHNRKEFETVVFPAMKPYFDIHKFPYAGLPMYEKALKWMLNPSLFTKNFLSAEQKGLKAKLDEIRWRILQK